MKLLFAEDEVSMAEAVTDILTYHNYTVDTVYDGADALDYVRAEQYDGIILDIMMPKKDGIEVLQKLRADGVSTPVMLLTAKSEIEDRVNGLNAGADDYLPKPFATAEFLARVKALSRRSGSYTSNDIVCGNTSLSCETYELKCDGAVQLNNKEFQIMELFMRNPRRILDMDADTASDVVYTYVGFLRRKLRSIGADIEIRTARGAGYSLEVCKC